MSGVSILEAEVRKGAGKGDARRLRGINKVPAILYGGGKDPQCLQFEQDKLYRRIDEGGLYSRVLTVRVGDQEEPAILKDVQRHPSKPMLLHIDLQRVNEQQQIRMLVPLTFSGADIAPGVKQGGGSISCRLSYIEVYCLPQELPETIPVDLSQLELGKSFHASDLTLPAGIEIDALRRHKHDALIAACR